MRKCFYALLAATFLVVSFGAAHGAPAPDTASCTYTISPKADTLTYKGGTVTIGIAAKGAASCPAPAILQNGNWIGVTSFTFSKTKGTWKAQHTGTGELDPTHRQGDHSGEHLHTYPARRALHPGPERPYLHAVPGRGAYGRFYGNRNARHCQWTATAPASESSWIGVTSGVSGTGTGAVDYTVSANTGKSQETGR